LKTIPPPGRLHDENQDFSCGVDFVHSLDALEKVILALRYYTRPIDIDLRKLEEIEMRNRPMMGKLLVHLLIK
jgi:hypothetical protein